MFEPLHGGTTVFTSLDDGSRSKVLVETSSGGDPIVSITQATPIEAGSVVKPGALAGLGALHSAFALGSPVSLPESSDNSDVATMDDIHSVMSSTAPSSPPPGQQRAWRAGTRSPSLSGGDFASSMMAHRRVGSATGALAHWADYVGKSGWVTGANNQAGPSQQRVQQQQQPYVSEEEAMTHLHRPLARGDAEMLEALHLSAHDKGEGSSASQTPVVGGVLRRASSSMRRASADFKRMLSGGGTSSGGGGSGGATTPASSIGRRRRESADMRAPQPRWGDSDEPPWTPPWETGATHSGEDSPSYDPPQPAYWTHSRTPSPLGGTPRRLSAISARISSPRLQSPPPRRSSPLHEESLDLFQFGGRDAEAGGPGTTGSAGKRASRALKSIRSLSSGALRRASLASMSSLDGTPLVPPPAQIILTEAPPSPSVATRSSTPPSTLDVEATPRAENRLLPARRGSEDGRDSITPTPANPAPPSATPAPAPASTSAPATAARQTERAPNATAWRRVQREASAAALQRSIKPIERSATDPSFALPPQQQQQQQPSSQPRRSGSSERIRVVPRSTAANLSGDSGGSGAGGVGESGGGQESNASGNGGTQRGWGNGRPSGGGGGGGEGGSGGRSTGGPGRPPGGGGGGGNNGSTLPIRSSSPPLESIFKRQELVGRGAYGAVYRGVHLKSGTAVALKVVNLDTPEDDVSDIQKEVALLSQLRETESKNVVKYWGCWLKGPELWIVMDFAEGGSVRTLMKAGPIAEKYCGPIMRESLVALSYLHKSGIIHRDIKAANILLTVSGRVLLCDFGVAASLVSSSVHSKRSTFVGTPYWMAPEVITEGKTYDQSADIWSLGITLYEMACGNPPHADQEQMRAIMLIPKSKPPRLPADGNFSPLMRDFLAACLNEEPRERPNADELSKSKWLKSFAKTPNAVLKDLLVNYAAWTKSGGMRMSLLGAEANDANNRDSFMFDGRESEDGWEFNTLRSQVQAYDGYDDFDSDYYHVDKSAAPAPVRDHPLLRLFDSADGTPAVETAPAQNTINGAARLPGFGGAPGAPGTVSARSASSTSPAKPQPSLATLKAVEVRPAPPVPTGAAAAAAAAAADKASFAGTGATPFRFGGGGGGGGASAPASRGPTADSNYTLSEPRSRRQQQSVESIDAVTVASSTPDTAALQSSSHVSNESSGTSLASTHERRPSAATNIHRRGRSSLSSFSAKSSTAPASAEDSPMLEYAALPGRLGSSPSRTRGPLIMGMSGESKNILAPPPLLMNRSASEQAVPLSAPNLMSPVDAQVLRARSAGPAEDGSSSAPAVVDRAATTALVQAQRYAAQNPGYGVRSRSGSRSRPTGTHDGTMGVGVHAPPLALMPTRATSAAAHALSFKDVNLPRSMDLPPPGAIGDDLLPPSPSTSASSFFPPLPSSRIGAWGPSPLGPGAAGVHQRRQHGGSDPMLSAAISSANAARTGEVSADSTSPWSHGSPSPSPFAMGPKLRPLDFAQLDANGGVHAELARVVEELGAWLDVLGNGLGGTMNADSNNINNSSAASSNFI